jgi:site-specific recombinase
MVDIGLPRTKSADALVITVRSIVLIYATYGVLNLVTSFAQKSKVRLREKGVNSEKWRLWSSSWRSGMGINQTPINILTPAFCSLKKKRINIR